MGSTQLLCTFCSVDSLEQTLHAIENCYEIAFNTVYILKNKDKENALCCTYNIVCDVEPKDMIPPSTISLHRKKQYNVLYTINALNKLIEEKNNGKLDKSFIVNWEELRNSILVTQYGNLKRINTEVVEIINLREKGKE